MKVFLAFVALIIAAQVLGTAGAFLNERSTIVVTNRGTESLVVRVVSRQDFEPLAASLLEPGSTTVFDGLLPNWDKRANRGYDQGVIVGVLSTQGCDLLSQYESGRTGAVALTVDPVGLISRAQGVVPGDAPVSPIADPCEEGEIVVTGWIHNRTLVPLAVFPGIAIPACSSRSYHRGDTFPPGGEYPEPWPPAGVSRVAVDDIAQWTDIWPVNPITVVISSGGVLEEAGPIDLGTLPPCEGRPPSDSIPESDPTDP